MTDMLSAPIRLPMQRDTVFDPPTEIGRLRQARPISPLAFPDGAVGWLVTDYATVRAVLADPRFSSRQELHHHIDFNHPRALEPIEPAEPGMFLGMDAPEHTRYRKLLTGQFTMRRVNQLASRIEEVVAGCLDEMERAAPPVDLVSAFALPIPTMVICELLGVPYAHRERFQHDVEAALSAGSTAEQMSAGFAGIYGLIAQMVADKRATPADDILSGLVHEGDLTDQELIQIAMLLLVAGHETTASMIALGTFALLTNPEQFRVLRDHPELAEGAVEELLRYVSVIHFGLPRTAIEDVRLGDTLVRAGDCLIVSIPGANHDPDRFEAPGALDVTRSATGHVAFGHGAHQCLGQQLARVEMRIAYTELLRRFPSLRLAVAPDEVPLRVDMPIYGVHRLPVTW